MENQTETGLIELVKRGGVYYGVPGTNPREVITNLIGSIAMPGTLDREKLLEAVLEREALMTTAVGHGIALPHPRNPLITEAAEQFVAIAFWAQRVDWKALDKEPVRTVMLIVSASSKLHLHTLSRINYFCQQESFRTLLDRCPPRDDIITVIAEAEQTWK
jgi:PTS system nitrogen regulatory IIA component